ncbi:hypothetical protein EI94DRAFT_755151 [Lactarius quietus]|nr:hypothetical protein EI94DRAFT_755151 [Lactarius quietus]
MMCQERHASRGVLLVRPDGFLNTCSLLPSGFVLHPPGQHHGLAPISGGGHEVTKGPSQPPFLTPLFPFLKGFLSLREYLLSTIPGHLLRVGLLAINSVTEQGCDGVSDARASSPPEPPSHFWKIQRPFRLSTSTSPQAQMKVLVAHASVVSESSNTVPCQRLRNPCLIKYPCLGRQARFLGACAVGTGMT